MLIEWLTVAVIATLAVALLAAGQLTQRADNVIFDTLAKLSVRAPSEEIVIVTIDNRSIAALGRWPWPRSHHDAGLRRLAEARPKAVGYDVLFVDPDRDPAQDIRLADAMKTTPVYLPMTFDVPGQDGAAFDPLPPVEPLRAAAAGIGQVNVEFDPDGVVRRAFLSESDGRRVWPHLTELLYRAERGRPSPAYERADAGASAPVVGALTRERPVLISFAGPPGHFRSISFVDLFRGEVPSEFLRGKLVLVGATADGLGDRHATPLSGGTRVMPGVELQANLLDALLTDSTITPAEAWGRIVFAVVPLWLLLAGFLWLRPRANMALGLGLMIGVVGLSMMLFLLAEVWIGPVTALAGLLLVYPLWSWRRLEASSAYMVEELRQFAEEPDVLSALSRGGAAPPSDVIGRQLDLLSRAIARARDLRRFVTDALQGLPDATLVTGLDERVIIANREAEQLFEGLSGRPAVGAQVADLTATMSVVEPDAEADGDEANQASGAADIEMETPRGETFNVRRTALTDVDGRPAGWIVRFTDITALKAAGRQREHILQLLTHDMRSPQVSILAVLENAGKAEVKPPVAARIAGYARRTLALADSFVHLARAETRQYVLEEVDLGDLLIEAVDDLWPQSQARKITVSTDVGDSEHLVMADRSLLTRVLINLIGNAVKYGREAGRVDCRVFARDGDGGREIVCEVADDGPGMSEEQLAHLFERFWRSAETRGIDGVGLGLAFVQAVVKRHGGAVSCRSRLGEGATFSVSLPAA
ncbi:CHASE2 domain-containing protein [Caulobacter mirabilis]|uniref:CHASE2 domain-containing protein n=1 Tax=Caulobacter mirabilis TaxID=69666 RepID=UPI001558D5FC|nr:CHASE2 domain-containing protein [Caulobacter mirabilis]